ncbi:MAG: hypothetical protein AAFQ07_13785 [Chloroflexota bacterium]
MSQNLELQTTLDALGHGILIFDNTGKLVQNNLASARLLGTDLNMIKSAGWAAAVQLFDSGLQPPDMRLEAVKENALQSERPLRFKIYRAGAYIPCWASAVNGNNGEVYIMLTLDEPDWGLVSNVIDRFRSEMREAVDSTVGHMRLIARALEQDKKEKSTAAANSARLSPN